MIHSLDIVPRSLMMLRTSRLFVVRRSLIHCLTDLGAIARMTRQMTMVVVVMHIYDIAYFNSPCGLKDENHLCLTKGSEMYMTIIYLMKVDTSVLHIKH